MRRNGLCGKSTRHGIPLVNLLCLGRRGKVELAQILRALIAFKPMSKPFTISSRSKCWKSNLFFIEKISWINLPPINSGSISLEKIEAKKTKTPGNSSWKKILKPTLVCPCCLRSSLKICSKSITLASFQGDTMCV